MNYLDIWNAFANSLRSEIDKKLEKAKFDRSFKARVIGKISDGKYEIFYRGKTFSASCSASLSTDQIVQVCAPQNNWDDLFIQIPGAASNGSSVAGVSGIKGSAETSYRTGEVNITPSSLGLGNVENKSSSAIRSELTFENITDTLGYTPLNASGEEFSNLVASKHFHENKSLLDSITQTLIGSWNSAVSHVSDAVKHITSDERTLWNTVSSKASSDHTHTKADIGLSNADNTADIDKQVLSAAKLTTPRKINGIDFDGTTDIKVSDPIVQLSKAEYQNMLESGTLDEDTYYLTTDDESGCAIANMNGLFTLSLDGWDLVAYYEDGAEPPPIKIEEANAGWNIYYEIPDE